MAITYAYAADIEKYEKLDSGDYMVRGVATDPTKDLDGQRCDPDWLKSAMPDWFQWGNIRDQHSSRAAGVAQKMDQLPGDAWWVETLVTDPIAQHKVETKTYKGYSIGIRDAVLKMMGGEEWIVGGTIVEVSLVDRPCNPTAKLALAKGIGPGGSLTVKPGTEIDVPRMLIKCAEVIDLPENAALPGDHWVKAATSKNVEEKDKPNHTVTKDGAPAGDTLSDIHRTVARLNKLMDANANVLGLNGEKGAMPPLKPGGAPRYPINSVQDLKDAIKAFGRAKEGDEAEVKAHIKSEAKRLGKSDLIPDNWKGLIAQLDKAEHDESCLAAIRDGLVQCISEELAELCQGERELCDVDELLCSLRYFMCWWSGEAIEGEVASPYDDEDSIDITWLAAKEATVSDQTGATATDTTAATTTQGDAAGIATEKTAAGTTRTSITQNHLTDLIKNAVTEATKDLQGRLTAAESALAKVAGAPQAGGPAITSTAIRTADKSSQADFYAKKAEATVDPDLRYYYGQKAAALRQAGN